MHSSILIGGICNALFWHIPLRWFWRRPWSQHFGKVGPKEINDGGRVDPDQLQLSKCGLGGMGLQQDKHEKFA